MSAQHVFDAAVALTPAGPDTWTGATHPAWNNMVGPFGGITAATALQGVMRHAARLGTPVALTVNYAAALAPGAFTLSTVPVRTNRSTQHWTMTLTQPGADGVPATVFTATAVTAARRATWGASDVPMPEVVPPHTLERVPIAGVEWVERYDMRPIEGAPPAAWDGRESEGSLSRLWVRDAEGRAPDFAALAAFSDVFFPRIWLRRARRVPAGTVSMTVYFHAGEAELARSAGWLLAQARGQAFHDGFADQTAQLWNEAGELLVTSHQIVYYKE